MVNSNTNINNKKISKQNEKIRKKQEKQKNLEKIIDSHSLKYYGYFTTILCTFIVLLTFFCTLFTGISALRLKKISNYIDTNNKLESTSAKDIPNIDSYVLSDLTGTSWEFNISLNVPNYFDGSPFYINFLSNETTYNRIRFELLMSTSMYYGISTNVYSNNWLNQAYRIISITGGTDATNSILISWLQANATQQQSTTQLTTPTITKSSYNTISWTAISNASNYAIYKDNVQLTTTNSTSYTATALGSYQVKALGDNINYSDSNLSNTITLSASQLSTPTNLSLSTSGVLSWDDLINDPYFDNYVISYSVYDVTNNQIIGITPFLYYNLSSAGVYQVKATSNSVFFSDSAYTNSFYVYNVTSQGAIYNIDVSINNLPFSLAYYYGGSSSDTFNLTFSCVVSEYTPTSYFLSNSDFTYNSSTAGGSSNITISSDNKTLTCSLTGLTNNVVFDVVSHVAHKVYLLCTNGTITINSITGSYTLSNGNYFFDSSNAVVNLSFTADTGYIFDGNVRISNLDSTFISNTDNLVITYSITNFVNNSSAIELKFSESITLNGNYAFIGSSYYNYYNLPIDFNLRLDFTSNNISFTNIIMDTASQSLSYSNNNTHLNYTIFNYQYNVDNLYFRLDYLPQDTANYYFITINDFDISINDYNDIFSHLFRVATNEDYQYLGYNNGLITANQYTMANLLFAIGDTPIKLIKGLLNFNFFGVNLFSLFTLIVTLLLVFAVFKFIKGGSSHGKD